MPWIGGQRLAIRRGMTGATGNIYAGLHEYFDMALVLHLLRPGDLFFDVGANVGSYSVLASGICGVRTWAFEPDPDAACAFLRNIQLNGLTDRVVLHEIAVGDTESIMAFTKGLGPMNHVTTGGGAVEERSCRGVAQRSLDGLVNDECPIMIKLDVEGHEDAVLRGALGLLERPALKVIALETLSCDAEELLRSRAFERRFYDPLNRQLLPSSDGIKSANAVYVRDVAYVTERLRTAKPITVLGKGI